MTWTTFWAAVLLGSCAGFAVLAMRISWRAAGELRQLLARADEASDDE